MPPRPPLPTVAAWPPNPQAAGRGGAAAPATVANAADRASLTVDAASPTGARGLYERAGFTVAGTHVRHAVDFHVS